MSGSMQLLLFLCLFAVLCAHVQAGTWLSFNSEQGLGELDSRRSIGPSVPLDVLLDNCRQESLTRATRSDKSKSEMLKLCKTLFERRR